MFPPILAFLFVILRISMEQDSNQPSSKLLEPVNLVLSVKRNLAASWYQKMAAIEVDGDLKPMKVCSHKVRTYSQLFKVTFHADFK